MARCAGTLMHPVTKRVEGCPYEALWDGCCYFHEKVVSGLIADVQSDGRRRRQEPIPRPLDQLLQEWG